MIWFWRFVLFSAVFISWCASASNLEPAAENVASQLDKLVEPTDALITFFYPEHLLSQMRRNEMMREEMITLICPAVRHRLLALGAHGDIKSNPNLLMIVYKALEAFTCSQGDAKYEKISFLKELRVFNANNNEELYTHQYVSEAVVLAADALNAREVLKVAKHSSVLFRNYDFVARLADFSELTPELVREVTDPRDFSLLQFPRALQTLQTEALLAVLEQVEFELTEEEKKRLVDSRGLLALMQDAVIVTDHRAVRLLGSIPPDSVAAALAEGTVGEMTPELLIEPIARSQSKSGVKEKPAMSTGPADAWMFVKAAVCDDGLVQAVRTGTSRTLVFDILHYLIDTECHMHDFMRTMERIYRDIYCHSPADAQQQQEMHDEFVRQTADNVMSIYGLLEQRERLLEVVKTHLECDNKALLMELMQIPLMTLARDSLLAMFDDGTRGTPSELFIESQEHALVRLGDVAVWKLLWLSLLKSKEDQKTFYNRELVTKYASPNQHRVLESWKTLTEGSLRMCTGHTVQRLLLLVISWGDAKCSTKLPQTCSEMILRCVHDTFPSIISYLKFLWPEDGSIQSLPAEEQSMRLCQFKDRLRELVGAIREAEAQFAVEWNKAITVDGALVNNAKTTGIAPSQAHLDVLERQLETATKRYGMLNEALLQAQNYVRQQPHDLFSFVLRTLKDETTISIICKFPFLLGSEVLRSLAASGEGRDFLQNQPSFAGIEPNDLKKIRLNCNDLDLGLYTVPKAVILDYIQEERFLINDPAKLVEMLHSSVLKDEEWTGAAIELFFSCIFECVLRYPVTPALRIVRTLPAVLKQKETAGEVITMVTKWIIGWELSWYRSCLEPATMPEFKIDAYNDLLEAEVEIRSGIVAHLRDWLGRGEPELQGRDRVDMAKLLEIVQIGPASVPRAMHVHEQLLFVKKNTKSRKRQPSSKPVRVMEQLLAAVSLPDGTENAEFHRLVATNLLALMNILKVRLESEVEQFVWEVRRLTVAILNRVNVPCMDSETEKICDWIRGVLDRATVPCCDAIILQKMETLLRR